MSNDVHDIHPASLRAFVLDQLDPSAREAIEHRVLTDEDLFARLRETEDDLLDAYVRDRLEPSMRARVDATLLAGDDGATRLAVARDLYRRQRREATPVPVRPPLRETRWRWALAAALVTALFAGWLGLRVVRLGNQLDQLAEEPRSVVASAATQVAKAPLTVALGLGLAVRGDGAPTLAVPAEATSVRLLVDLEEDARYPHYRARLDGSRGVQVWFRDDVETTTKPWGVQLILELPTEVLPAGRYELTVRGHDTDGVLEDVGFFPFAITQP